MNVATAEKPRPLTIADLAQLSREELIVALANQLGLQSFPLAPLPVPAPRLAVVSGRGHCPHCGHRGPQERDFGFRVARGEMKPQSWCRKCRAKPGRVIPNG